MSTHNICVHAEIRTNYLPDTPHIRSHDFLSAFICCVRFVYLAVNLWYLR